MCPRGIRSSPNPLKPARTGRGYSLVELLVALLLVAILASIVVPVARSFISRGRSANCASNLRQIGMAVMMYASDNHMRLPVTSHQRSAGGRSWTLTLQPYASGTLSFKCPADPDRKRIYTYTINDYLTPNPAGAPDMDYSRLASIPRPAETLMFGEATASYRSIDHFHFTDYRGGVMPPEVFESQVSTSAHLKHANHLFADGHVETLSRLEALRRVAAPNSVFIDPTAGKTP